MHSLAAKIGRDYIAGWHELAQEKRKAAGMKPAAR
jgi:hypothetical protein